MLTTATPTIVGPADGEFVQLQTVGVRFMIPGAAQAGSARSVIAAQADGAHLDRGGANR
jgi:hypothetical protein